MAELHDRDEQRNGDSRPTEQITQARESSYYDAYWESEDWECYPPRKLLELFERHVSPDDRCLDVGCGDGGTSGVWLSEHAAAYVGVDISERAVRMSRERGLEAQRISDAAELPFANNSFDFAVCIEVLEHLFEPQRALAEVQRVLRPGGRAIVTVPNVAHWRNRLDLAVLGIWNPRGDHLSRGQPWRDPHIRFFSIGSLARLVELCGFDILERGGHAHHGLLQHMPGLRKLTRTAQAGRPTRRVVARFPRLLAENLYVVGRAAVNTG